MRYPIGVLGTKQEFQEKWYIPPNGEFGAKRENYIHEGIDLNLKTGGDTDLGQPLHAVANGTIRYYHEKKHANEGFGKHMVLECQTPFGVRWYHYAHCLEITNQVKDVKEGDVIGKLGKTGTKYAHLHFAVFKVDPSTLRSGIDTIAKTEDELNKWWENPFLTLDNNHTNSNHEIPNWFLNLLAEFGFSLENESQIRAFFDKARKYDDETLSLQEQLKSANETLSQKAIEVSELIAKNQNLQGRVDALEEIANKQREEKNDLVFELQTQSLILEKTKNELESLKKKNEDLLKELNLFKANSLKSLSFWDFLKIKFGR